MKVYPFVFLLGLLAGVTCLAEPVQTGATHPGLQYVGRTAIEKDKRLMGFSGVSVKMRFSGSERVSAKLGKGWGKAPHVWAILDGDAENAKLLLVEESKSHPLFEGISEGEHVIELVRLSGAWTGTLEFKGFVLDEGAEVLEPPKGKSRRIEFQGDSITEGTYWPDEPKVNPYLAYAMSTARLLDAEPHLVAKSGIGLVRGYALPQTLPSLLDRQIPMNAKKKWDFSQWQPHVVVTNIGQNDKWTWKKSLPEDFISAYADLLKTNRSRYPDAYLIAALGSMDATEKGSAWPGRVTEAVERFKKETGDKKVATYFFPFTERKGHPNAEEAAAMAEQLAEFLEQLPGALPVK